MVCPMCRKPIDKAKVVKKILEAKVEHDDPFAMGGDKKVQDDVVIMPP